MESKKVELILVLFFTLESVAVPCNRDPEKAIKPQNRVEINRYVIEISGNPKSYVPGENYTINLRTNPALPTVYKFTEFILVVEPDTSDPYERRPTGNLYLHDNTLTAINPKCANSIVQTNSLPKLGVSVFWVAPAANSGCVAFRATVVESKDNWFRDDGDLTKILCEEDAEDENIQPPVLTRCCACEEAKYEVAFQGMWSRNTHPKDFPTDVWKTKFSDIVGASHKLFKSFWNYGGMASEGLKLVAEEGNTKELENELKEMSEDIRTIIKARELTYPNITGTSYTVFRADKDNHVISLVSKITPSPDWIVGVASLELCLRNCSWVHSRTLNLYPWDVGTNDGVSYISPAFPTLPPQPIKRITANNPNREESPFHNPDGDDIKPLAKLHVTLQKLYDKECDPSETGLEDIGIVDPSCATTEWSPWSLCTNIGTSCAKFRQRSYVREGAERHCQLKTVESVSCTGDFCSTEESGRVREKCEVGQWSDWSNCSASCGKGVMTRDRQLSDPSNSEFCKKRIELEENEECEENTGEDCDSVTEPESCPNTTWTEWSPCTVSCGTGVKRRYRIMDFDDDGEDDVVCSNNMQVVECYKPPCVEVFGPLNAGAQVITSAPDGPVVNCQVSDWSVWGPCSATEPCKKGYQFRARYIKVHAQNGGRACPKKLQNKRKCKALCPRRGHDTVSSQEEATDCEMGSWSAWSPCSSNCGRSALQIRTRNIKVHPSRNGRPCGPRVQQRECQLPLSCIKNGDMAIN